MPLWPAVLAALRAHGLDVSATDSASDLRARLNERYLVEVRALRAQQRAGAIALSDYATAVGALRARFPLLSLPLAQWEQPPTG